jgi:ABC-type phosphate/phosphonate transport system substrate-binding protein
MRRKLLLLAAVVAASTTVEATDRPTLHMGAISAEVPATMRQRIEPLAKYLTSLR